MCIAHAQSVLFVADIDILTIARENGCCDVCLRFQRAMVSQWDTSRRRRVEWGSAHLHWVSGVIAGEHAVRWRCVCVRTASARQLYYVLLVDL